MQIPSPPASPSNKVQGKVDQNTIRRRGVGLIASDPERVTRGYLLVAPLTSNCVYLIDTNGDVAHKWTLPYRTGRHARILPNGNLAINSIDPNGPRPFFFFWKYGGGIMSELSHDGSIVRQHRDPYAHHDAYHYGDGRILYTRMEQLSEADSAAVQGGVPGTEADDGRVWADVAREVDADGRVTWEWKVNDHLDKHRFAVQPHYPREHWPLINSIYPLKDGNILMSMRSISAVIIVHRATGEVIWHLDSTVVAQQHNATELPNGNILLFDNGAFRYRESFQFSRVIEVDRQTKEIVWQWRDQAPERFYSPFMGSAQRLESSGHTLVCESAFGRVFEIDEAGEVCWEWINPFFQRYSERPLLDVFGSESNAMFRAYKYMPEEIPWLR
ncbi:hypothetical protein BAUCODRAFT_386256 [Baudoinia panamericana UAMH 10762]|uniref:Uncharacterized protein n=1 Tax=Baudoinia panamericana (strain UAMH 10762) TaxID=717646 RepID=M2N4Q6_BAUPA|nr:uncharacterized protein BAUCODRAFT_386256 [Baudoinia panamericana UAMH 10762]EMC98963.1 hypothetical protein BAUCODRAFT_386256 [Baudoinia panamericana UAMH 10762]